MSDESQTIDRTKKRRRRRRRRPTEGGDAGRSEQPAAARAPSEQPREPRDGESGEGGKRRRRRRRGDGPRGDAAAERAQAGAGDQPERARGEGDDNAGNEREARRRRSRGRRRRGDRDVDAGPRGDGTARGDGDHRPAPHGDRDHRPTARDRGGTEERRSRSPRARGSAAIELSDAGGSGGLARQLADAASSDDLDAGWDLSETRDPIAGLRSDPEIHYGDAAEGDEAEPAAIELAADLPSNPDQDDPDPTSALVESDDYEPGHRFGQDQVRNVVGVKYAPAGKIYLFDGGDEIYRKGEQVVVESDRGPRLATVAVAAVRAPHRQQLKQVLRRPDKGDLRNADRNEEKAREVLSVARERARELKMGIKVFRAEYAHTGKRVRIYFTAEHRVDFRDLVRDLSRTIHARIEMRQTGVRDQAKMVGGIGSCGRELCCSTWLPEFVPVSIKNAKDQGLVLNPTKVSGQCGRLKCCLVYEQALYSELRKGLPKMGKRVVTPEGEGRVVEVDVLHQRVRVSLGHGEFSVFAAHEVERMFPAQQPAKTAKPRKPRGPRPQDSTSDDGSPGSGDAETAEEDRASATTEQSDNGGDRE